MFIQGYYIGDSTMTQVLYNEGVQANPLSTDVDTVKIELRVASDPDSIAATFNGLLQTDGSLTATFPGALNGGHFYLAVHHRNALETWSADSITLSTNISYDFTTADSQSYGSNMIEVETGIWAFYSGDVDDGSLTLTQDGAIDISDFIPMDTNIQGGVFGYYATDLNGDGITDITDFLFLDPNIQSGVVTSHP